MSDDTKPNGKPPNPAFEPRRRRKGTSAKKRRFDASYKLRIVEEAEAIRAAGGSIGELLRREGLYSSHLTKWSQARDAGALAGLGRKRGRKPDPDTATRRELQAMRAENERLQRQLAKANAIIDVQKKLCALLELESTEEEP